MSEFRSASTRGELCICGDLADTKVEEVIFHDDPFPVRHPRTSYLCIECFGTIMHGGNGSPIAALRDVYEKVGAWRERHDVIHGDEDEALAAAYDAARKVMP